MTPKKAYNWLREYSIDSRYLESAAELLAWDQRVLIPPKGHPHRANQLASITKLLHRRAVNPEVGEMLGRVEDSDLVEDPASPEAANIREWRRAYDKANKVPEQLAVDLAKAAVEGETVWEKARPENDWDTFKPFLERIMGLLEQKARAIGYEREPYDALLDDFEPGETTASLETVFTALRRFLVDLIERIKDSRSRPDKALLRRSYPIESQQRFAKQMVAALGYDLEAGRIDVSAHPFTVGIGPGDARITVRYFEDFFNAGLFGAIHEAGHAMYEQGLPAEHWGTPAGSAASLGIHESQSRLWENLVGRSRGFWQHALPIARTEFDALKDADLDRFALAINAVEPSLNRVEADEVTYNLHILLRFELELALTRGDLKVADLPGAWNEKMKAYLGVEPPDMASGVMQDIHWAAGVIGYFPTYTLGNLYAAQLHAKAAEEIGNLHDQFARGEFAPLLQWLRAKIHCRGGIYRSRDLIANTTGSDPDPAVLERYFETKYAELYGI